MSRIDEEGFLDFIEYHVNQKSFVYEQEPFLSKLIKCINDDGKREELEGKLKSQYESAEDQECHRCGITGQGKYKDENVDGCMACIVSCDHCDDVYFEDEGEYVDCCKEWLCKPCLEEANVSENSLGKMICEKHKEKENGETEESNDETDES